MPPVPLFLSYQNETAASGSIQTHPCCCLETSRTPNRISSAAYRKAAAATAHSKAFPELALRFPAADLLGVADFDGLVRHDITFETFDKPTTIITSGRHKVFVTALAGEDACVLKQFDFAVGKDEQRIFKEASALRKLDHPHVVKLLSVVLKSDVGIFEAYIHMPYYTSGALAEWLPKHSSTPEQAVLHQFCRGVEYIHANGILHCDIKLETIFMDADVVTANPLLADFDISNDADQRATQTQTATSIQGTKIYMAPETLPADMGGKGERQTALSDMYAFGVVCLLTFSSKCRENIGAKLAVAHCQHKPEGADVFFATREIWEAHQRAQQSTKVRAYLDGIGAEELRKKVVIEHAVIGLLFDLGIDANEYLSA